MALKQMLPLSLVGAIALVVVSTAVSSVDSAPPARPSVWGKAIIVPGLAALDHARPAKVTSVSCPTAGNCAAVGTYHDRHGRFQVFVVDERHGRWHDAMEIPGTTKLNVGIHASARVGSVSCATPGNCAAGGYYTDGDEHHGPFKHAFLVTERNGRWDDAIEVPGTASFDVIGARVNSVSCAAAGDCVAGGYYTTPSSDVVGFVVAETHGRWRKAIEVPGLATLDDGDSAVRSVSCATAGNCAVGGYYEDPGSADLNHQAFVADETNGHWGKAIEVPGMTTLNSGAGDAEVVSVSCATAGSCTAGGFYPPAYGEQQGFVVDETDGTWSAAIEVPGSAQLKGDGEAAVQSVSCATAGNCAAGGLFESASGLDQAVVADETDGHWGNEIEIPGTAILKRGGFAFLKAISCPTSGNCIAGGSYEHSYRAGQPFIAVEADGSWSTARDVRGATSLHRGTGEVTSASCATAANCVAVGYFTNRFGAARPFVVSFAPPPR